MKIKRAPTLYLLLILVVTCFYELIIYFPSTHDFLSYKEAVWKDQPLMTTPDGYLFLRYAKESLAGIFTETDHLRPYARPASLPLISYCAAQLSRCSGIPLETIAFYAPSVIAYAMVAVCLGLGRVFNSYLLGVISFFFAAASPMWFYRTHPGNFDTDGLNQLLFWGAMLLGYHALRGPFLKRSLYGLCWLLTNVLLYLWWPQAALPFIGLGLTFLLVGLSWEREWHRYRRTWVVAGVLAIFMAVILAFPHLAPQAIQSSVGSIHQHLILALGNKADLYIPIGKSISELISLSPYMAIKESAGSVVLFVLSLIGTIDLMRREKVGIYFIVPGFFFFSISFVTGNRFLIFFAPILGLGIAWFLVKTLPTFLPKTTTSKVLVCILSFALICYVPKTAMQHTYMPRNDHYAAGMAEKYKERSPHDAKTWNWWGPGYFIQYFSERATFIDGGSQTDQRAFISAVPFATNNPTLARNWIRFFSEHPNGIDHFAAKLGSKQKAISFLKAVFSDSTQLDSLLLQNNIANNDNWKSYLFPKPEVYLFLLHDMLYNGSWLPIGKWTPNAPTALRTTTTVSKDAVIYRHNGIFDLPSQKGIGYSKLYFITPNSLSHDPVRDEGPVLVLFDGVPYLFVVDQQDFDALAFRLLFIDPEGVPGFTPIAYHPYVGGVWKVD